MATIYNSQSSKEITDVCKIQTSKDRIPTELAEKVIPVIDVNPKHSRICNVVARATGTSGTVIYTTPTNKDFYLCACSISYAGPATKAAVNCSIRSAIDGILVDFIDLSMVTLTAGSDSATISFPFPIKLDKGITIQLVANDYTAIRLSGTAIGFTIDNPNA